MKQVHRYKVIVIYLSIELAVSCAKFIQLTKYYLSTSYNFIIFQHSELEF